MLLRFFIATVLLFSTGALNAQNIIIDNTPTPADLVTNTLIGPGLVTSNITFNGDPLQIGFFEANGSNIGLDSGVVMSSGSVLNIAPPGNPSTDLGGPGDPDVLATAQSVTTNPASGNINSTNDAAVLEFDFVPDGDEVIFNFVFSSEEYLTWINSQYNDAFGFYISGPNPAGGNYNVENLALVPGTNEPITISTIYIDPSQTPPFMNGQYFLGNPSGHSFNGFTVPIEIRFDVICDSTYHFKFAVADCVDGILDTGVFLEGGSFQAIPVDLSLETNLTNTAFGDSIILEGCGVDADFVFTRPSCQSGDSLWVSLTVGGTATNGVDYGTLPDSVLFEPGSTQVTIPFSAFQDGIFEGYESVVIDVLNVLPSGDTIVTSGVIWLFDQPNVNLVPHDTLIQCLQDSLYIHVDGEFGVSPYTYAWANSTETSDSLLVPADVNGVYNYVVTITDFCGFTDTDSVTVTVNQTLAIDSLIMGPASACNPDGFVSAIVSGETNNSGQSFYHWDDQANWDNQGSGNFIDASVWQDIPSGWYHFTVEDDVCLAHDSVFVEMLDAPNASMSATPDAGCVPVNVTFTNNSQNATSYEWDFGGGNVVNVNDLSDQQQTFTVTTTVQLVATDDAGCSDTTTQVITVTPCGCTDPNATNFNPLATIDDGSCIFPEPIVECPNVFTPNGDAANEFFFLNVQNASNIEMVILNRWGNEMYVGSGLNPAPQWDGTTIGGLPAEDGVYFVKYKVTGIDGTQAVEGHNFVRLVRQLKQ